MSIFKNIKSKVTFQSDAYTATADRLRIAQSRNKFENRFELDTQDRLWETVSGTNNTLTHLPNESGKRLTIGTTSGDVFIRQTKQYFVYTSGKPHRIKMGIRTGASKSGLRRRFGYFNANNGIFLQQTDSNISIVRRTKVSGSVVDNTTNQSNWNVDTFDGNGDSGITLDLSNIQMVVIDFNWYGAGTIHFGFEIDNEVHYVHEISAGNNIAFPIVGAPSLPVRYEIENTSGTGSSSNLDIFGGSVITDSDDSVPGFIFSADNGSTAVSAANGTKTPILSIRPKLTYNGIENRGNIDPQGLSILTTGTNIWYEIILNATLTGPSWTSVDADSIVEKDVTATAISGGKKVQSGYLATGNQTDGAISAGLESRIPLTINHDATSQDILTVVATGLGGASDTYASLNWKEIY